MPSRQDFPIESGVALGWAHVPDPTVAVIDVVPTHEVSTPGAGGFQVSEALQWELGPVLGGAEQGFRIRVVVAY
jgi:hypothetical protein